MNVQLIRLNLPPTVTDSAFGERKAVRLLNRQVEAGDFGIDAQKIVSCFFSKL